MQFVALERDVLEPIFRAPMASFFGGLAAVERVHYFGLLVISSNAQRMQRRMASRVT
jgi:hypothetical protein